MIAQRVANEMMKAVNEVADGVTTKKEILRGLRASVRYEALSRTVQRRTALLKVLYWEENDSVNLAAAGE